MRIAAFLPAAALSLAVAGVAQELPAQAVPSNATAAAAEPAAAAPITLQSDDAEITRRLSGIFSNIEGLENVSIDVQSGVVHLGGTTLSGQQKQQAADIARRLVGVVQVDDNITTETRVTRRVAPEVARLRELGKRAVAFLPLLLVAFLVFGVFWLIGRLLTGIIRPFRRLAPNHFVEQLLGQVVRLGFGLAGFIVAMNILGLTALLTSVLGAAGVFGLAVGFAVRDTIENYIASILLSLRQPFAPGDHVLVAGYEGRIALLNSRATVLVTLDGNEVQIPNATIYKGAITNFSHLPERKFEFEIGVGADADLGQAVATARKAVEGVEGLLAKPEPTVLVDRVVEQASVLKVSGWVDQGRADLAKVKSKAIRAVKGAFAREEIRPAVAVQIVRIERQSAGDAPPHLAGESIGAETEDTGVDPTISEKAQTIRARSDDDLLEPGRAS